MVSPIIIVVGLTLGGIMAGAIISFIIYTIGEYIYLKYKKRKFPKDKKQLSEYIKNNPETFKYIPREDINEKEVNKDERRSIDKFREFEKLRRTAERAGTRANKTSPELLQRNAEPQRRELFSLSDDEFLAGVPRPAENLDRTTKSSERTANSNPKQIRLTKPTDF